MVPVVGEGYISPKVYDDIVASAEAWARRQIGALVAKAKKAGVRARGLVVEGHGRTGVAKFFLGSVAGRVPATAPCPVLTVRGKGTRGRA